VKSRRFGRGGALRLRSGLAALKRRAKGEIFEVGPVVVPKGWDYAVASMRRRKQRLGGEEAGRLGNYMTEDRRQRAEGRGQKEEFKLLPLKDTEKHGKYNFRYRNLLLK